MVAFDRLFSWFFGGELDDGDDGYEAPNDLEGEGKPGVFREEADGHAGAGAEVEKLVEIAVFDFTK